MAQQREQILAKIEGQLIDKYAAYPEDIREEAKLIDDIGMDSLDKVELVMWCESEFRVSIDDDVSDKIETVGELVSAVDDRVVQKV